MTKLDEIQERIDTVQRECLCSPESEAFIGILTDLVSELKRIDADVKRQRVMPPSPDSANLEW